MSEKETCALCGEPMCACDRSLVRAAIDRCGTLEELLHKAERHLEALEVLETGRAYSRSVHEIQELRQRIRSELEDT